MGGRAKRDLRLPHLVGMKPAEEKKSKKKLVTK